jgi:hypothetical protein
VFYHAFKAAAIMVVEMILTLISARFGIAGDTFDVNDVIATSLMTSFLPVSVYPIK